MRFQKKFSQLIGICTFFVVMMGSTVALAKKTPYQVRNQQIQKQQLLNLLGQRIQDHRGMTLEEIQQNLHAQIERNREWLRNQGQLSERFVRKFQEADEQIDQHTSKEELIRTEEKTLLTQVSASNWMFAFSIYAVDALRPTVTGTMDFFGRIQDYEYHGSFVAMFLSMFLTIPLDLAFIVPEAAVTIITYYLDAEPTS